MANEFILTYGYAGKTITAKVLRGSPLTQVGDTVTLSEDVAYIYAGDVAGTTLQDGDLIVYYDTEAPIGSEVYHPEVKVSNPDDCKADVSDLTIIKDLLEADLFIDTTQTPWEIVYIEKGTGIVGVGTELMRKQLKEIDGSGITALTKVVGQHVHTT